MLSTMLDSARQFAAGHPRLETAVAALTVATGLGSLPMAVGSPADFAVGSGGGVMLMVLALLIEELRWRRQRRRLAEVAADDAEAARLDLETTPESGLAPWQFDIIYGEGKDTPPSDANDWSRPQPKTKRKGLFGRQK